MQSNFRLSFVLKTVWFEAKRRHASCFESDSERRQRQKQNPTFLLLSVLITGRKLNNLFAPFVGGSLRVGTHEGIERYRSDVSIILIIRQALCLMFHANFAIIHIHNKRTRITICKNYDNFAALNGIVRLIIETNK